MSSTLIERLLKACGNGTECKCTLQEAAQALERAQFSHYATEPRDMLRSLQEANMSIGYACEWLRHYIIDGEMHPITQAITSVGSVDQSMTKHDERIRKLKELEVTLRCAQAFQPTYILPSSDTYRVTQRIQTLLDELFPKVED